MTWVRLDDNHDLHRKVARLSDLAYRLWVSGAAWCHRQKTPGVVPLGDEILIIHGRKARDISTAVGQLVAVGLWHKEEDCYRYHDWHTYQTVPVSSPSERGKAGAAKRWAHSKDPLATIANPVSYDGNGAASHMANDGPIPSQPNPTQPNPSPERVVVPEQEVQPADPDRERPLSLKWEPSPEAVKDLASHFDVPEARVLAIAEAFKTYWTIGKGMGKARRNWQAMFRQRVADTLEGRVPEMPKADKPAARAEAPTTEREPERASDIIARERAAERARMAAKKARPS